MLSDEIDAAVRAAADRAASAQTLAKGRNQERWRGGGAQHARERVDGDDAGARVAALQRPAGVAGACADVEHHARLERGQVEPLEQQLAHLACSTAAAS